MWTIWPREGTAVPIVIRFGRVALPSWEPKAEAAERDNEAAANHRAYWKARAERAEARLLVTDEMVERGLNVSREFPMRRGLDNARNVMRAVLEAALRGL